MSLEFSRDGCEHVGGGHPMQGEYPRIWDILPSQPEQFDVSQWLFSIFGSINTNTSFLWILTRFDIFLFEIYYNPNFLFLIQQVHNYGSRTLQSQGQAAVKSRRSTLGSSADLVGPYCPYINFSMIHDHSLSLQCTI